MLKIICIFICFIFKSFCLIFSYHFLISFISLLISIFIIFLEKIIQLILVLDFLLLSKLIKLLLFYSFILNCFCISNALPREEYVNLACSVILVWSDVNIPWPVRYSYLQVLPDNNADILAASLIASYFSVSSLILSSIVLISYLIINFFND